LACPFPNQALATSQLTNFDETATSLTVTRLNYSTLTTTC